MLEATLMDRARSRGDVGSASRDERRSRTLVHIQQEAYMFTLGIELVWHRRWVGERTYRSMHVPGLLSPTRRTENPSDWKTSMYQGLMLADRSMTRPPILSAWFNATTWSSAAESFGSNQSIESMTMAMVRVLGVIRARTSLNSSV